MSRLNKLSPPTHATYEACRLAAVAAAAARPSVAAIAFSVVAAFERRCKQSNRPNNTNRNAQISVRASIRCSSRCGRRSSRSPPSPRRAAPLCGASDPIKNHCGTKIERDGTKTRTHGRSKEQRNKRSEICILVLFATHHHRVATSQRVAQPWALSRDFLNETDSEN